MESKNSHHELPPRSFLFVPADRPDFLAKAESRGADALIIDLEDAVSPTRKDTARRAAVSWLDKQSSVEPIWVRVNRGEHQQSDLDALSGTAIAGVMLPKVEEASEIEKAIEGFVRSLKVIVIIETAKALRTLDSIAKAEGIYQLMIGEADLGASLGMQIGHPAWDSLRIDIVAASIAANVHPPIASVNPNFADPDTLREETRHFRNMGYVSRPAIHPAQIETINDALKPSPTEVMDAKDLLARHEAALADDRGAHGQAGQMIDEAFVRRARWTIARHNELELGR